MYEQATLFPWPAQATKPTPEAPTAQATKPEPTAPAAPYYPIDEATARRAQEAYSFRDYVPGSATAGYRASVDEAAALVAAQKARVSPYYHDKLDALLDRYSRRLAEWTNAKNRNTASCPSVMISGAGHFPTAKKAKQNAREDSLWAEYNDIEGLLDKIRSVGTGGVDLADPHAREILTEQLQAAQNSLERCKAMNAYFRKNKTLRGFDGLSDAQADKITDPEGFTMRLHGKPCPDYELTSIRDKIKRTEARLAELDKRQEAADQPQEVTKFPGGEIVRNLEQNRLQIVFDDKPDEALREKLKGEAFRWSPKNNAWQRQLTQNAERAARRVLGL